MGKSRGTGKKLSRLPTFNKNCITGPDIPGVNAVLRASHNQYPIETCQLNSLNNKSSILLNIILPKLSVKRRRMRYPLFGTTKLSFRGGFK